MRTFRNVILQRLCTALLLAGVGLTLVPTVEALDVRVEALGALLGDREAVVLALEAAQTAPTPESAADAFAMRYVEESAEPASRAEIVALLLGEAFGHVAPVTPDVAFVPTPPTAPAPRAGFGGSAILANAAAIVSPESGAERLLAPRVISASGWDPAAQRTRAP